MIKRILYISAFLLIALWARPVEAGCYYSCYDDYGYYDYDQSYTYDYYDSYYNSDYDPIFGDWYGVDNRYSTNNPFGDWYGVDNRYQTGNPFGDWYGVDNRYQAGDPFGDWYGVDNRYDTSVSPRSSTTYRPVSTYQTYTQPPQDYSYLRSDTYRVAPMTGVDKVAPFAFAGLLVAGLFVVRQRKWLFN